MNRLLISDFGSSTRGERQFFKVFRIITTPTTFGTSRGVLDLHLHHSGTPTSYHHCRTQLLTIMVGPQLQLFAIKADNPTLCPHGPKITPQLTLFQNFQILMTIASAHDVIHSPVISYLGFIMTIMIVISFARKRKLYPMYVHLN